MSREKGGVPAMPSTDTKESSVLQVKAFYGHNGRRAPIGERGRGTTIHLTLQPRHFSIIRDHGIDQRPGGISGFLRDKLDDLVGGGVQ